jgi:heat shock protein HslJ
MTPPTPRPIRSTLLIVCATLLLVAVGCGSSDSAPPSVRDGHPGTLAGTSWRVVSVAGQTPVVGREPTVIFTGAAAANGTGGCNSWFGAYAYDPNGGIRFQQVGMTAMACAEAAMNAFEGTFITALQQVNLASLDPRGLLVLSGPAGQIFLAAAGQPSPSD